MPSAIEVDVIRHEVFLPFQADHEKLRGNEIHQFPQLMLWDRVLSGIGQNTPAVSRQPDFCGIRRRLALRYMHVKWFIILV